MSQVHRTERRTELARRIQGGLVVHFARVLSRGTRIWLIFALFCGSHSFCQSRAINPDLEGALVGKDVISKILLGCRAIPQGLGSDYPVNTLASPDGAIRYRVEWGLVRTDVVPGQMVQRFGEGTPLRIKKLDFESDRLELELGGSFTDSAKLKLMLGRDWQSRMKTGDVLKTLASFLTFPRVPKEPQGSANALAQRSPRGGIGATVRETASGLLADDVSAGGPADRAGVRKGDVIKTLNGRSINTLRDLVEAIQSAAVGSHVPMVALRGHETHALTVEIDDLAAVTSSASSYRQDAQAAGIPGRISGADLQLILAEIDQEMRNAFASLAESAAPLATGLQGFQRQYSHQSDYGTAPLLAEIGDLQGRLGIALQPETARDVGELNSLFARCLQMAALRQVNGEPIMGLGKNWNQLDAISVGVNRMIGIEHEREISIERASGAIIGIERALDRREFNEAHSGFQKVASDSLATTFKPLELYLAQTESLRADLAAYSAAAASIRLPDLPLLEAAQRLARDVALLGSSRSKPITSAFLEKTVETESAALKGQITALQPLQIDTAHFKIPQEFSATNLANASRKLSFLQSRSRELDDQLAPQAGIKAIVGNPELMDLIERRIGPEQVSRLRAAANEITSAEGIRASLGESEKEVQNCLKAEQERLAKGRAAEQARVKREAEMRAAAQRQAESQRVELQNLPDDIVRGCLVQVQLLAKFESTHIPAYLDQFTEVAHNLVLSIKKHRKDLTPEFWRSVDQKMYRFTRNVPVEVGSPMLLCPGAMKQEASNP